MVAPRMYSIQKQAREASLCHLRRRRRRRRRRRQLRLPGMHVRVEWDVDPLHSMLPGKLSPRAQHRKKYPRTAFSYADDEACFFVVVVVVVVVYSCAEDQRFGSIQSPRWAGQGPRLLRCACARAARATFV